MLNKKSKMLLTLIDKLTGKKRKRFIFEP